MPFIAASAAPCGASAALHPTIERAAERAVTVFFAPPGYLPTESLAAVLAQQQRPVLWLRLEPEDRDPATLLIALIAAAQRLRPGIGEATLEQMRRHPGPLRGWPPLFAHLGHELAGALPATTALVLERGHYLGGFHPTLQLFSSHLLPAVPSSMSCVVTAYQPLPHADLPAQTLYYDAGDLRLDQRAAHALAERIGASLTDEPIRRAVALTDGRAAVLEGLFVASAQGEADLLNHAIARAFTMDDLLARLAHVWLVTAGFDERQALALAVDLEYSHPDFIQASLGCGTLPAGPWLQSLNDGWKRVRAVWQAPLRKALGPSASPTRAALQSAADYLARQGAIERAIALYLAIGEATGAARTASAAIGMLMGLGQWEQLADWLRRLPAHELHTWPWLIYARGEIASLQGDIGAAHDAFVRAGAVFMTQQDAVGACQSLLAESSLAAARGDNACAQQQAQTAFALGEASGLTRQRGWAAWHLADLAAHAGDLDAALAFYDQATVAADAAGDTVMVELLRPARQEALRQRDLRRQREFYRQAYFAAERAEHEAAEARRQHHSASPDRVAALLDAHGWMRTPLALKLATPPLATDSVAASSPAGFWQRLLGAFGIGPISRRPTSRLPAPGVWPSLEVPEPLTPITASALPAGMPLLVAALDTGLAALTDNASIIDLPFERDALAPAADSSISAAETPLKDQRGSAVEHAPAPTLTVHLLGQFRVILNDHPVVDWPSGRGRAMFKYLLTHRQRPVPRDVLMDAFWPDAEPEAARNNLNVTLHRLRHALRTADELPIVRFEDGAYRFNPDLQIWLDVDEFERHVRAGRRLEDAEQIPAAAAEYELAIGLYQGDFLEDDPYEDWPVLPRERLRVAYLDTLDRLSQMYFDQERFAPCIMVCQQLVTHDSCREDAHCRLMRCYSRQGQRYLALRQYQVCAEALRAELDVEPDTATTQLYEQIRRREQVS
jgi:DNA-binding SARP family transcriptional activator